MSPPTVAANDCPKAPSFRASLSTLILHEACQTAGGIGQLATLLCVSLVSLNRWLDGEEVPPDDVYQACIHIVLLHDETLTSRQAGGSSR